MKNFKLLASISSASKRRRLSEKEAGVGAGRRTNGCSRHPVSASSRLPEAQLKMLNCSWEAAGAVAVGVCSRAWGSRPGSWVSLMFGAAGRQPIGAPAAGNSWWGWRPRGWEIWKGCDGRRPLDLEWKGEGVVMDDLKTFRPCSHSCLGWTQFEEGIEVCAKDLRRNTVNACWWLVYHATII